MLQVLRDADHPYQGLKGNDSAGSLRDGYRLFGVARAEDARPCRGLQDRGTQRVGSPCRCPSDCCPSDRCHSVRVPTEGYRGPETGPASLSHQSSRRSIGDNSSTRTARAATFGDSRRQVLGHQTRVGGSLFADWDTPPVDGTPLKVSVIKRLAENDEAVAGEVTHVRVLMRSGAAGGKGPVEATKNDTSQNLQYIRQFWRGRSSWLIDSSSGVCRLELMDRSVCGHGRAKFLPATTLSPISTRRRLIAVRARERLHRAFPGPLAIRSVDDGAFCLSPWSPGLRGHYNSHSIFSGQYYSVGAIVVTQRRRDRR